MQIDNCNPNDSLSIFSCSKLTQTLKLKKIVLLQKIIFILFDLTINVKIIKHSL